MTLEIILEALRSQLSLSTTITAISYYYIKKMEADLNTGFHLFTRARDGTRTRGLDLGKVALHQLSHSRKLLIRSHNRRTNNNIHDAFLFVNTYFQIL